MSCDVVDKVLTKYRTVVIVGLSRSHSNKSYKVAEYLKNHGFHILPVNPFADEVLDEKCYSSLLDMPDEIQKTIEIVDVFRPSHEVLSIVEQLVQMKKRYGVPHVFWMQLGIINEQAAEIARKAGLIVIMDRCMMREHRRLSTRNNCLVR